MVGPHLSPAIVTKPMADFQPDADSSIDLWNVRQAFLDYKYDTVKDSSARVYKFPTKSFIQYLEGEKGQPATVEDITSGAINNWIDERRKEVKIITAHQNAKLIRVWTKWLGQRDMVEWGIHNRIQIPDVPERDDVNEDWLKINQAHAVLDYLGKYHYATVYHAFFRTMWHTACRVSGAIALDLRDYEPLSDEKAIFRFRNRKQTGTPLKNSGKSERDVTVYDPELITILNDYIEGRREDITDESDRHPLFTTPTQRLYRQRAYKNVVAFTRPCVYGNVCPHDREIEDCDAANHKHQAPSCPSSISLHPVRKGAIGNHLNEGWDYEPLSKRADVGIDVLEKHYDLRGEEKKRSLREEHIPE